MDGPKDEPRRLPSDLTLEEFIDLETPYEVQISPQGTHIVYTLKPDGQKGKHKTSALWIADVGKAYSARQLTSGLFHDRLPQWSPDGNSIAFLSDRSNAGKTRAIYLLSVSGATGRAIPQPITEEENESSIENFKWSPDGIFIAFLSADEKSGEDKRKKDARDDAKVYGEDWKFARLRLVNVRSKEVENLVEGQRHVANFAWNSESTMIAYIVQRTPDLNSPGYHGVDIKMVSLLDKHESDITHFPGRIYGSLVWCNCFYDDSEDPNELQDSLSFLAGNDAGKACTSSCQYLLNIRSKQVSLLDSDNVVGLTVSTHTTTARGDSSMFLKREKDGVSDCIADGEIAIFISHARITSWDVVVPNQRRCVYAVVTSKPSAPPEVYSFEISGQETWVSETNAPSGLHDLKQLSKHSSTITQVDIASSETIHFEASDGEIMDAFFMKPKAESGKEKERKPLHTVVLIHGGPYARSLQDFDPCYFKWAPYLLSAGYGILIPNYRGGSGKGEKWASAARGGVGTRDYLDIIETVKEAIKIGLVDQDKVIVGGWSQGGFLSYLCAVRDDIIFKGAICGAGVADWDMLCMTSDLPWFEAELIGKAPWATDANDVSGRHASAVWHMHKNKNGYKTPVLILHGEEDKRVPVTQAVAFHRGCLELDWPCEFVVYPREEHIILEREHLMDMLKRVRRFCDLHLR
jgi:dipeptidyl aminopeptidase/acylaminoacyl peptidase